MSETEADSAAVDIETKARQIKELWNLYNSPGASELKGEDGKPPFVIFNPPMYSEQYLEKMKKLQQKKAKRERKTQKREAKNVKTAFKSEYDGNYDIDSVLEQLGEMSTQKGLIKKK